jgi:hypothetical protein
MAGQYDEARIRNQRSLEPDYETLPPVLRGLASCGRSTPMPTTMAQRAPPTRPERSNATRPSSNRLSTKPATWVRYLGGNGQSGAPVATPAQRQILTRMYGPAVRRNVWSGRASQEVSSIWRLAVSHQCIRPLIGAVWAPGHHGYQRACGLISRQASNGPSGSPGFAGAGKTGPPSRFILSQTSAGKRGLCHRSLPISASCQRQSEIRRKPAV